MITKIIKTVGIFTVLSLIFINNVEAVRTTSTIGRYPCAIIGTAVDHIEAGDQFVSIREASSERPWVDMQNQQKHFRTSSWADKSKWNCSDFDSIRMTQDNYSKVRKWTVTRMGKYGFVDMRTQIGETEYETFLCILQEFPSGLSTPAIHGYPCTKEYMESKLYQAATLKAKKEAVVKSATSERAHHMARIQEASERAALHTVLINKLEEILKQLKELQAQFDAKTKEIGLDAKRVDHNKEKFRGFEEQGEEIRSELFDKSWESGIQHKIHGFKKSVSQFEEDISDFINFSDAGVLSGQSSAASPSPEAPAFSEGSLVESI